MLARLLQPAWTRRQAAWGAFLLAALAVGLYSPAPANDFINWDDTAYVTNNPLIRHVDGLSLRAVFSHFYLGLYIPLVWVSYMVDYQLWPRLLGTLPLDPVGFHLQNVFWFAATASVIFFLLRRLSDDAVVGWLGAALFAAHPTHVESVAWATERKDVLFGFFFFLSLLAYVRYRQEKDARWYAASLLTFGASCLAKLTAVILPVALVLVDWALRENPRKLWREKAPFFGLSLVIGGASYLHLIGLVRGDLGLGARVLLPTEGALFYLAKGFWPLHLAGHYPMPRSPSDLPWGEITAALLAATVISAVLVRNGHGRAAGCGVGIFFLSLLPVLQILPTATHLAADRYLYVSTFGVCWALALTIRTLASAGNAQRAIAWTLAAGVGIAWSVMTWQRIAIWRDSVSFWSDVVRQYPYSDTGYFGLARAYNGSQRPDRGKVAWARAISLLTPAETESLRSLDELLAAGRYEKAAQALARDPQKERAYGPMVYRTIGEKLQAKGAWEPAAQFYQKVIAANPDDFSLRRALGYFFVQLGRPREAIEQCEAVLSRQPSDAQAWESLALAHRQLHQTDQALTALRRALRYDPSQSSAALALAELLTEQGRTSEAEDFLRLAIAANVYDAALHYTLGTLLLQRKSVGEAVEQLRLAVALNRRLTPAQTNLGLAYFASAQIEKAAGAFRRALELEPQNASLWAYLATALDQQKKTRDAITAWERASALEPLNAEYQRRLSTAREAAERKSP